MKHALAALFGRCTALAGFLALTASTLLGAAPAVAQPLREPKSMLLDLSNAALIGEAEAKALLKSQIPAKVWKLYPEGRWTFLSQVEGGITPDGICVVTARVVMLPRTATVRAVLWRPKETATAYGAKAGANVDECKSIARDKLEQAATAVVSALIKH
jgi:hypothetical protein